MKVKRPKIDIKPVASHYQAPNERIMEVSSEVGGCLISVRVTTGGSLVVDVYRADDTVHVLAPALGYVMSEAMAESLRRVLAYTIPDEAQDYAEQMEAGVDDMTRHIMTDLDGLAAWLDAQGRR